MTKIVLSILLFLAIAPLFSEEIKVYRGSAFDFPNEYYGVKESPSLFFAYADLAEGMFIELYTPSIASSGVRQKSAQVLIIKRIRRDTNVRGSELTLSPNGSDYFSIYKSGYLVSNPRDNHSLNYLPQGFDRDTKTPDAIASYIEEPIIEEPIIEEPIIEEPIIEEPIIEKPHYEMFGDSIIYLLEEAEEKPPIDDSLPINMDEFIDEYEYKDEENSLKDNPEQPSYWTIIEELPPFENDLVTINPPQDDTLASEAIKESSIDQYITDKLKPNSHYIQVGVYSHSPVLHNNIVRLKSKLPVVIVSFKRDGVQLYRLLVGSFKADELGVAGYTLRLLGFTDFFLVNSEVM